MSDLEYLGKINPKPFISLRKEEEMRVKEIKERIKNEGLKKAVSYKPEPKLTYERYASEEN